MLEKKNVLSNLAAKTIKLRLNHLDKNYFVLFLDDVCNNIFLILINVSIRTSCFNFYVVLYIYI